MVAGGFVFVSGQVPREPSTGIVPEGIEAQTRLVLRNLNALLEAAGASLKDVVKITAHLARSDNVRRVQPDLLRILCPAVSDTHNRGVAAPWTCWLKSTQLLSSPILLPANLSLA